MKKSEFAELSVGDEVRLKSDYSERDLQTLNSGTGKYNHGVGWCSHAGDTPVVARGSVVVVDFIGDDQTVSAGGYWIPRRLIKEIVKKAAGQ